MAQRRPRTSLGPPGVSGSTVNRVDGVFNEEEFKDFKRRHSRQNKEIILDNVNRKSTVKSLQEEIASLHVELLEVRQANAILQGRMKRMHDDTARLGGRMTREALDHIFAAIPALRQLQDSLSGSTPSSGPSEVSSGISGPLFNAVNPVATRPAAAWAEVIGLGTVSEATEFGGSEDGDERNTRRRSRGRRSGVGSVAASRSPLPLVMRDSIPRQPFLSRTLSPASPPRSSASPSPQKRSTVPRSPNTEKKHKRRRESGLLLPRTQKRMPEESESGHLSESQGRFRSSVGRGDAEVFGTAQLKGKGKTRAIEDVRMKDIAAQLATVNSMKANTKRDTVDMAPPHKESPSRGGLSPVGEEDGHDTTPTVASFPSRTHAISAPSPAPSSSERPDDAGGRGRRARQSVNYKEPSLTKKMRKPDGLTAEDALRGRPSLSGLLSPGDTPTQSYPHFPAMRRKSVLPKQSSLSTLPIEDDDDEDEVDDSPALLADTEVPLVITHAEEDDAADYLASGDHARTPTPTPRELPLPTGRASLNVPTPKGATPMGSKLPPTRVSPLKGGAALNPPPARKNGTQPCGVTRPPANGKLPRARATMQSVSGQAGNRDALASLPVENGQAGVARIKPAGKGPGEQAAARRASMAVYNVI